MTAAEWNQIRDQVMFWIQNDRWMAAAIGGLVLAGFYLTLLLVTRLGDVRPSAQSFVLSTVLNGLMLWFWGTLMFNNPEPTAPAKEVVIRNLRIAEETPDKDDFEKTPVWDKLPPVQKIDQTRQEAREADQAPIAEGELRPAVATPDVVAMAPLSNLPPLKTERPEAARIAATAAGDPLADMLELNESTADSRTDVSRTNQPQRLSATRTNPTETMQVRPASRNPATTSDLVEPVRQRPDSLNLPETDTPVRRRPEGAPREIAAIPTAPGLDDPGFSEPAQSPPARATGSRFERVGRSRLPSAIGIAPERRVTRTPSTGTTSEDVPLIAAGTGVSASPTIQGSPRINRSGLDGVVTAIEGAPVPGPYQLRNRRKGALPEGATRDSEQAVELSLKWLSFHQNPAGFWDADGFSAQCPDNDRCEGPAGTAAQDAEGPDRQQAGKYADTGLTALVILAYLGADYTHERGQYADQVDRAIRWLIRQQTSDGFLGGNATRYDRMYCHGMATYALGEAYGMTSDLTSDPQLRDALTRAVNYIVVNQNPDDGGWRYLPGQKGDMSMFGWQLMALKSAEFAGVEIPELTRTRMVGFLNTSSLGTNRGLAAYRVGDRPTPAMTAEALFAKQMLGMKRSNSASREAIDYLLQRLPKQSELDLYYWYYGTLAMFQYGGEPWERWNAKVRDTLVVTQRRNGHAAGSWEPRDPWSSYGGRIYSTALSTLCLEVYYRFLPLYRMGEDGLDSLEN